MNEICEVSDPELVLKQLKKHYGNEVDLYISTSKHKKYMVFDEKGKKIHFGSIIHEDYTKHQDKQRKKNLEIETEDGKMLKNIHLLIYRIICYGD